MKKLLFFLLLALLLLASVAIYNYIHNVTGDTPTLSSAQPSRLRVPHLGIDAPVMGVGQTPSGAMDAPTSNAYNSPYWTSVFWYKLGAAPGQEGNVVIAGHIDRVGGDPAVFWGLGSLRPGDAVSIVTYDGFVVHYVVDRVVTYPANYSGQDAFNAVFGPTTGHHLNLITCSGFWTNNGYDQRLVVFTTQTN
jgi:hypothetical protein